MVEFLPLDVTPEQRDNLETLWRESPNTVPGLAFDMESFMEGIPGDVSSHFATDCGTVACMAGRGPACGVLPKHKEFWFPYVDRVFCSIYSDAFDWLFQADWADRDNTLEGARKRLRIALDQGIPKNYLDQLYGQEPLMYEVE